MGHAISDGLLGLVDGLEAVVMASMGGGEALVEEAVNDELFEGWRRSVGGAVAGHPR